LAETLMQRRLLTLADCEALWTHARDPLALVSALVLLDPPLPDWLTDGLLLMVTEDEPQGPATRLAHLLRRGWKSSNRARAQASRVMEFARVRKTAREAWIRLNRERAAAIAAHRLRDTNVAVLSRLGAEPDPLATAQAMERTVVEVRRAVTKDPWWGWAPPDALKARLMAALEERGTQARPTT
jgi:hypothetical protein